MTFDVSRVLLLLHISLSKLTQNGAFCAAQKWV